MCVEERDEMSIVFLCFLNPFFLTSLPPSLPPCLPALQAPWRGIEGHLDRTTKRHARFLKRFPRPRNAAGGGGLEGRREGGREGGRRACEGELVLKKEDDFFGRSLKETIPRHLFLVLCRYRPLSPPHT